MSVFSVHCREVGGWAGPSHDKWRPPLGVGTLSSPEAPAVCSSQVVSGCLGSLVSVWEMATGRRMMEFSVTGEQCVELTAMCLDEPERRLLTGLRDGTIKMWNYTMGECLLTFPNPDQLEVSLAGQPAPGLPCEKQSTPLMTLGVHCLFLCLLLRLCLWTAWLLASLSPCILACKVKLGNSICP